MDKSQLKDFKSFLSFLFDSGDKSLVLQTFGEGQHKGERSLTRVLINQPAAKVVATIDNVQANGGGVFVQLNGGSQRGKKYIETVRAVFLDMDGAPLENILDAVKQGFPTPHMIVESSPGRYHVYWKCDDVTLQNWSYIQKTLAQRFGGDESMINLDRVIRLPGTKNFKYDAAGFDVTIKRYKPDAEPCSIADLLDGMQIDPPTAGAEETLVDMVNLGDSLIMEGYAQDKVSDITELKPGDRTQKIIRIAGALVAENPDMDFNQLAKLLVSEVEKRTPVGTDGPSADSWNGEIFPGLKRFVERRDEELADVRHENTKLQEEYGENFEAFAASRNMDVMTLKDFTDRFVYVGASQLVFDLEKSPAQTPMSLQAFKTYAQVFKSEKGGVLVNSWLKSRIHRRTVDTTTYRPYPHTLNNQELQMQRIVRDHGTGELAYNTYSPSQCKPLEAQSAEGEADAIKPFLEHMVYLFPNEAKRKVFIDWVAATVQRPDRRVTWAPFIVSKFQGVGKGWIAQLLSRLVGRSNYRFITVSELEKNNQFNDFLSHSSLVVIDEVHAPRREDIVVKLQPMITEPELEVNHKFGQKRLETIYSNFILFSNYEDALQLYASDRRFFVHIFNELPREPEYYSRLFRWLDTQDIQVLHNWLLKRDISNFGWGECPKVKGDTDKLRMHQANRNEYEDILEGMLEDKEGPFISGITNKNIVLFWMYNKYDVDVKDKSVQALVSKWLRSRGSPIGRVRGTGMFNHATWYSMDPTPVMTTDEPSWFAQKTKQLIAKVVEEVYGQGSPEYKKLEYPSVK